MKKTILAIFLVLIIGAGLWTAKTVAELAAERTMRQMAQQTLPQPTVQTVPETEPQTAPETTAASTETAAVSMEPTAGQPVQATTEPEPALIFTEEEEELLLKLGMAERGSTRCIECMALVMRTVLNRVESPKFSSTIKGVVYAQDQFTPAMDGTLEEAEPDWFCQKALEMVKQGWDESQGALYYEWSEGTSWHSQNLNLLLQHCDTRFYN